VAWVAILETCIGLAAAAITLLAIAASLSRMGFAAALAGLFVAGAAVLLNRGGRSWIPLAGAAAVVLLLAALLPSTAFIQRFDSPAGPGEVAANARVGIWRDTLHLIGAFPLAGCGFGAFQSAYMHYQTTVPTMTVNFAHNDYLQLMAELGVPGFLALAAAAVLILRELFRRLAPAVDPYFAAACLGALAAIALHSLADFNLYKPANAVVVAWIAGLAASGYGRTTIELRGNAK